MCQSFLVALPQPFQRSVGVAIGLQVGKVAHLLVVMVRVEADAVVNLLGDALRRLAVGRIECVVVAEDAAMYAQRAVAVGAAESGIDGQLLYPMTKTL